MLLGGDEIGRSQQGNNNAYCQDNETSWFDWEIGETGWDMYNFVRDLIAVMQTNPILRRRPFSPVEVAAGMRTKDVTWIRPDGTEMTDGDWSDAERRSIGMLMLGKAADEVDVRGRRSLVTLCSLLLNAGWRSRSYTLPLMEVPGRWEEVLNTTTPGPWTRLIRSEVISLTSHSCLLLRHNERPKE